MAFLLAYDSVLDTYVPELWANESLAILLENMVIAQLVHRDFEDEIASFGDVVNTRRPGEFVAKRKTVSDDVTLQDLTATNVQVPLDQHFHTSFIIRDEEWSKSFKDLSQEYLVPAVQSLARAIDQVLLGQYPRFLDNVAGHLNGMTTSTVIGDLLELREVMNVNKAYVDGRNLILTPYSETTILSNPTFLEAQEVGDAGAALREARLGRKLGFNIYQCQNMSFVNTARTDKVAGTVTNATPSGTTGPIDVTITGYVVKVGEFVVLEGDDTPQVVTALTSSGGDTTTVTITPGLKRSVAASADITVYKAAQVNGTYAAKYAKGISIDNHAANKGPQVGQILAFGTGSSRRVYTVIQATQVSATETTVVLDRPLELALADNDYAFPGPAGNFNLAFHRNALALVNRPLAAPPQQYGVAATTMADEGVAIRVTSQYNSLKQGLVMTLDLLCGVQVLDTDLGAVLLG